jgi:hypothetical protein
MKNNFIKYYRVFKNDTAVTEVSVNDFKPVFGKRNLVALLVGAPVDVLCTIPHVQYSLLADDSMFYGYLNKFRAMEKAKEGALAYINQMIEDVEVGMKKLAKYRHDHYSDLNVSLLDANIRRIKKEIDNK